MITMSYKAQQNLHVHKLVALVSNNACGLIIFGLYFLEVLNT